MDQRPSHRQDTSLRLTLTSDGHLVQREVEPAAEAHSGAPAAPPARPWSDADLTPDQVVWDAASRVSLDGVSRLRSSALLPGGIIGADGGAGGCGGHGC